MARGDLGAELPIEEVPLLQVNMMLTCKDMRDGVRISVRIGWGRRGWISEFSRTIGLHEGWVEGSLLLLTSFYLCASVHILDGLYGHYSS